MIVGESGSGRSTFINSLCGGNSIVPCSLTSKQDPLKRKLSLRQENIELEDNEGHKISLNIIDTPNFANLIDCEDDFKLIVDYIRHQYDEVLLEESRVKRNPRFKDGRIHALIYMIYPRGHGLSSVDIKFMQYVNNLVNLIPVIAKADSLTPDELKLNKRLILEDLDHYGINYYKFNEYDYEADYVDEEIREYNKYLNSLVPFSIIGANSYQESLSVDEDLLKLRVLDASYLTPINIEQPEYNDFIILKNVLLITHLNEFKDITHDSIYEAYRTRALSGKQFQYVTGEYQEDNYLDNNGKTTSMTSDAKSLQSKPRSLVGSEKEEGEDLSYEVKEDQIQFEEERLKKFEERVHKDLIFKRKELLERENELKEIERRLIAEGLKWNEDGELVKASE